MASQTSVWDKVTGFVATHKAAVIVGSVVVVGSGAGAYYYYTNSITDDSSNSSNSKPKDKKAKKLTKHDKKKLKKAREAEAKKSASIAGFDLIKDENQSVEYPDIADFAAVKILSEDDRKQLANQFKLAGNEYFSKKSYEKALDLYSKAILCANDPIFHSNRAACYTSLQQFDKVIEETSAALELKPDYQKCLLRRAAAYEKIENYSESLFDYTSALILSDFKDGSLNTAVDRVLKTQAEREAASIYATRPKKLPTAAAISAFFRSFSSRVLPEGVATAPADSGDYEIKLAFDALNVESIESYEQAFAHFDQAIEKNATHANLAYTYRAIFKFLTSDTAAGLEDVKTSIDLEPTALAYIARANMSMDDGNVAAAKLDYENAIKLSPDSPDSYYHRAQVEFITGKLSDAAADYEKCISIDPNFVLAHIQLGVTTYRGGDIAKAVEQFEDLERKFPDSADVANYFGEILMDQKKFGPAVEKFEKALELGKKSKNAFNVLPLVNKALVLFQSSNAVDECIVLCLKAVTLDPLSDVANATLAQVYLQNQQIKEAYGCLMRSVELARTVPEMVQHLCLAEATNTQLRIVEERPFLKKRLDALQSAVAASQR